MVDWLRDENLRSLDTEFGFIGSQGDRRIREMVKAGVLERRLNGRYAEVRLKRVNTPDMKQTALTSPNLAPGDDLDSLIKSFKPQFGNPKYIQIMSEIKRLKCVRTENDKISIKRQIAYLMN